MSLDQPIMAAKIGPSDGFSPLTDAVNPVPGRERQRSQDQEGQERSPQEGQALVNASNLIGRAGQQMVICGVWGDNLQRSPTAAP